MDIFLGKVRELVAGCRKQVSRGRIQEAGSKRQEAGFK